MPPEIRRLLEERGRALEALGFRACGAVAEDYLVDGVEEPSWSLLYRDPNGTSVARLTLAESPTRIQPVELEFYSFRADGEVLETVAWRAHRLPADLPGQELVDAKTLSWEEQWQCHREALGEGTSEAVAVDAALAVDRLRSFAGQARQFELDEGRYVEREDGTLRFGLRWALSTVMRANKGEGARLKVLAKQRDELEEASHAADLTPDLAAHRRRDAVEQSRSQGWAKKLVFFTVSMLLFMMVFGIALSPRTAVLLVAALIIHELGHALAMRFFGYKDLQILFIPFLGAVASGRKDEISSWQEIIILLAGPVPGIAIGTLLLVTGLAGQSEWLADGAKLMLILNYLNLLPIIPLDGGRMMSIVFFERWPLAQWGFSAFSAIGVMGLGLWYSDHLITCVGLALLIGIPRQLTQVKTFSRVREALRARRAAQVEATPDPVRSVYAELQSAKFDRWNSETKYQFVRHVLERLDRRSANLRVAMASLTAYCAVVVLPVGVIRYSPIAAEAAQSPPAIEAEAGELAPEGADDPSSAAPEEAGPES